MPNQAIDFPLPDGSMPLPGHRLHRLELYNWGTFHQEVATLMANGRWTLLVGENGSGKSTMVDAMRTLLVPRKSLSYNDSSGEQRRLDRSRKSYMRGTWANRSQGDFGGLRPQNLREPGKDHTILLAVFVNQQTASFTTLVQILWETGEESEEAVFAIASGDRSISKDLSHLGTIGKGLQKTLRERGFEPFDRFSAYAQAYRASLGIKSDVAIEVFNQAIGVKEISKIDSFIRQHLLDKLSVLDLIKDTLRPNFQELDACKRAIERAEKQLKSLSPITALHVRYNEIQEKIDITTKAQGLVHPYFGHIHLQLCDRHADELNMQSNALAHRHEIVTNAIARDEKDREAKQVEISHNAVYLSIERLSTQIEGAKKEQTYREQARKVFQNHLKVLEKSQDITSADHFDKVKKEVVDLQRMTESLSRELDKQRIENLRQQEESEKSRGRISREIESLRKAKVLVPVEQVERRDAFAHALGLPASKLPFVAELIEVKQENTDWTGAIERLLRRFALTVLVPSTHVVKARKLIEGEHQALEFLFQSVSTQTYMAGNGSLGLSSNILDSLNFREGHVLKAWLQEELLRRFPHTMCESLAELGQVEYGLTRMALVREENEQYAKDDRHELDDVRGFVLGWSVEEKIIALMREYNEANVRFEEAKKTSLTHAKQAEYSGLRLAAAKALLEVASFADIDALSVQQELARLRKEKEDLESGEDSLRHLKTQLEQVKERLKKLGEELDELNRTRGALQEREEMNNRVRKDLKDRLQEFKDFDMEKGRLLLGAYLPDTGLTPEDMTRHKENTLKLLDAQFKRHRDERDQVLKEMLPKMSKYLTENPEHANSLAAAIESAPDFAQLKATIEAEELPKYKDRFEDFLSTNLVGGMATLRSHLTEHETNHFNRVKTVNSVLKDIPFKASTHVEIVHSATRSDAVRKFKAMVNDCLAGGLIPDVQDRLRVFENVRKLMAEFDQNPEWMKYVADARNWLDFGVREKDKEGNEVHYYADSAGKSDGQKAQLAFIILASAIVSQYGLLTATSETDTFRLVVIDEVFAHTDEANSKRALELFKKLGLQLIVVNPFDAKGRIVEDYVDSFHFVTNPNGNHSRIGRTSRKEYLETKQMRENRTLESEGSLSSIR